jgi:hypothetical protein
MRSLFISIAIIILVNFNVLAQLAPASYPVSFPKTMAQSVVTTETDSLQSIQEKEWNKHLIINSDSRVDSLIQIHREENARKNGIEGYRVQIYQGTKDEAYKAKARFLSMHDNISADVKFPSPDFVTVVGDFRTRSEALKLRNLLKDEYPVVFIVDYVINLPKLNFAEAAF